MPSVLWTTQFSQLVSACTDPNWVYIDTIYAQFVCGISFSIANFDWVTSLELHLFGFKSTKTFKYFCRSSCFRTAFPTAVPPSAVPPTLILWSQITCRRRTKQTIVKHQENRNRNRKVRNCCSCKRDVCLGNVRRRVSFGFLGNIPNSNPGPVSGFFFVARLVWFLDNAREQKIPFCIPFWDLENCQNHQRCVAPQLSMASWQEIVKCSGAGNKTQIQKEKPHMGNGKKRPDYIARCVWKCNTTNGNTLHVPHAPDTPHTFPADSQMRRRQLAAKGPTESTDLSTPAEKQTGLARGISESVGKATPQPFCNRKRRWRRRRRRWWEPAQCYSDGPWVMLLVELFTRKDFTRGRGRVSERGK